MLKLSLLLISLWVTNSYSTSISNHVVDISNWQKDVDLSRVHREGIAAVIHKATEGTTYTDAYFAKRMEEASEVGLLWGAYHFAHGGDPVGQADFFLKTVGNTADTLLVLDIEPSPSESTISPDEAEAFVTRIQNKTGRYPMIYGSGAFLGEYNRPNLNKCSLWIASWTSGSHPSLPSQRNSWVLWQYTNGEIGGTPRSVEGIGPCDRDKYNGSVKQLREQWPNL